MIAVRRCSYHLNRGMHCGIVCAALAGVVVGVVVDVVDVVVDHIYCNESHMCAGWHRWCCPGGGR